MLLLQILFKHSGFPFPAKHAFQAQKLLVSPMKNIKLHEGYRSTERQYLFIFTTEGAYFFFPQGFLDYPLWTLPWTSCPGLAFLEILQLIIRYYQHNPVVSSQCRLKLQYCSKVQRKSKFQLLTNKHDEMHLVKQINQAKSQSRLNMKKTLPILKCITHQMKTEVWKFQLL